MDKLYNDIYSPFAHKMYENSVELTDNWFLFGDFFSKFTRISVEIQWKLLEHQRGFWFIMDFCKNKRIFILEFYLEKYCQQQAID